MVPMYGTDSVGVSIQDSHMPPQWGPSLLVAAMRAYVAWKFGSEVELPCGGRVATRNFAP